MVVSGDSTIAGPAMRAVGRDRREAVHLDLASSLRRQMRRRRGSARPPPARKRASAA